MISLKKFKTLELYISKEFLLSFFVCFLFYFFVFFFNQILLLAKGILAKGVPLGSVLLLLLYSVPTFNTLSLPFATLTAALMTFGRFSSENEILAMHSLGFSKFTIFRPVFLLGALLFVVSFFSNDFLLPRGSKAFQKLWLKLTLTTPGLELDAQSIRKFKNSYVITGDIDKDGIHPLTILERNNYGAIISLIARRAVPQEKSKQGKVPGFEMQEVFTLIPDAKKNDEWTWNTARSMRYRLLSDQSGFGIQSGPSTMNVSEIWDVLKGKNEVFGKKLDVYKSQKDIGSWTFSLAYNDILTADMTARESATKNLESYYTKFKNTTKGKPKDHSLQVWKLEFYQKFALPLACIPFVVMAFPLGLTARRSGREVGFFIGLLLATLYWTMLIIGRSLGLRSQIPPFSAMLLPDLILLLFGAIMFVFKRHS